MDQQADPANQPKPSQKKGKSKGRGKGKGKAAVAKEPVKQEGSSSQDNQRAAARRRRRQRQKARRAAEALSASAASAAKIDDLKEMDFEERMRAMARATVLDLGSARAIHIRTAQNERHVAADAAELAASRRSNQKGSEEAKWAEQEGAAKALSAWSNFAKTVDPNAEQDDGTAGQSHRARMVANMHGGGTGHHAGSSSSPRGGRAGRAGRGGGTVGSGTSRGLRVAGQDASVNPAGQKNVRGGMTGPSTPMGVQPPQIRKGSQYRVDKELARGKGSVKTPSAPKKQRQESRAVKSAIAPPRLLDSSNFVARYQSTSGLGRPSNTETSAGLDKAISAPKAREVVASVGKENQPARQMVTSPLDSNNKKPSNDIFGRGSDYIPLVDVANQSPQPAITTSSTEKKEIATPAVVAPVQANDVSVKAIDTPMPAVDIPVHVVDTSIVLSATKPTAIQPANIDPAPFFNFESVATEPVATKSSESASTPIADSWATVLEQQLDSTKFGSSYGKDSSYAGIISSQNTKYKTPARVNWNPQGPRPRPAGLKFLEEGYDTRKLTKEGSKPETSKPQSARPVPAGLKFLQTDDDTTKLSKKNVELKTSNTRSTRPVPAGLKFLQAAKDAPELSKKNVELASASAAPAGPIVDRSSQIPETIPQAVDVYDTVSRVIKEELKREGLLGEGQDEEKDKDDYDTAFERVMAGLKKEGLIKSASESGEIKSELESGEIESDDTEL